MQPAVRVQAVSQVLPPTARPAVCFQPSSHRAQSKPNRRGSAAVPRVTGQARLLIAALGGMVPVAAAAAAGSASGNRLLIVGPGVLGSYLGKLWVDENGAGSVVGQTNTTANHAK